MTARLAIVASALLLAATINAHAQPRAKVYRIGYIQTATPEEQAHLTKAFVDGLRDLGYVDGRNIVIEQRYAWGKQEALPQLAADLVRQNVDVIVTGANPVIAAVKRATTTIPVVMGSSTDPIGSGFAASLARPGGNITGLSSDPATEVQGKRLALLKEAVPKITHVALLWNPLPPGAGTYRAAVEDAARKLGLSTRAVEVRGRNEFEAAFASMAKEGAHALVVIRDPVFFTARDQVVRLATKHHLPAIFHAREFVEIGGFMSYGSSLADQFRRAAFYVDKILKGAKPADLPIEQPMTFELVVNTKTAKALGISIPQTILVQATSVVQ